MYHTNYDTNDCADIGQKGNQLKYHRDPNRLRCQKNLDLVHNLGGFTSIRASLGTIRYH